MSWSRTERSRPLASESTSSALARLRRAGTGRPSLPWTARPWLRLTGLGFLSPRSPTRGRSGVKSSLGRRARALTPAVGLYRGWVGGRLCSRQLWRSHPGRLGFWTPTVAVVVSPWPFGRGWRPRAPARGRLGHRRLRSQRWRRRRRRRRWGPRAGPRLRPKRRPEPRPKCCGGAGGCASTTAVSSSPGADTVKDDRRGGARGVAVPSV